MTDRRSGDVALAERLAVVQQRIDAACRAAGRDPAVVTLVAVSKRKPAELIRAAYAAGQRDFGENYAQELRAKADQLRDLPDIRWHFIGPLQTNKAKVVVGRAVLLHSVATASQIEAVSAQAAARATTQQLLLQLNLSGEHTKSGVALDEAATLLARCDEAAGVRCVGLMTMPPPADEPSANAPYFTALAQLRERLGPPSRLPHLSMGMSDDYEIAIASGATIVRVGSAIFGARS